MEKKDDDLFSISFALQKKGFFWLPTAKHTHRFRPFIHNPIGKKDTLNSDIPEYIKHLELFPSNPAYFCTQKNFSSRLEINAA